MSITDYKSLFETLDKKLTGIKINNTKDIRKVIADTLNSMGIYFKGENTFNNNKSIRFVLNSKSKNKSNLYDYINGTIFEVYEHLKTLKTRLLCIGFENYNKKVFHDINKLLELRTYKLYKIMDGFKITIYYSKSKKEWIMATKNAFEITNLIWKGNKYGDVINDVFNQYPEFNVNKLNKNFCYSFIMHHPAFNYFNQPALWKPEYLNNDSEYNFNKSATLLSCFKIVDNYFIKQHINNLYGIVPQVEYTIDEIIHEKKINYFGKLIENNNAAFYNYIETGKIDFGYILKNNNNKYASIKIESSLYNEIKKFIYDVKIINKNLSHQGNVNYNKNFKQIENIIIYTWCKKKEDIFISLFPNHKHYFDKLNLIINNIALLYCKNNVNIETLTNNDTIFMKSIKEGTNYNEIINYLSVKTHTKINSMYTYNVKQSLETNYNIILNILYSIEFLDIYSYKIFNIKNQH